MITINEINEIFDYLESKYKFYKKYLDKQPSYIISNEESMGMLEGYEQALLDLRELLNAD